MTEPSNESLDNEFPFPPIVAENGDSTGYITIPVDRDRIESYDWYVNEEKNRFVYRYKFSNGEVREHVYSTTPHFEELIDNFDRIIPVKADEIEFVPDE